MQGHPVLLVHEPFASPIGSQGCLPEANGSVYFFASDIWGPRRGQAPCRPPRAPFNSAPPVAAVRVFSPRNRPETALLPAAFWGFQDSENLVEAPSFGGRDRNLPSKIPPQRSFRAQFLGRKSVGAAATDFRPATAQRSQFPSRNARSQHNSNACA